MSLYEFKVNTITGKEISMSEYKDYVLLIVNVASQCGFTGQYEGLENLYRKYKDSKFAVLGFPCNQFGGQESGTEEEIQNFCETRFNVTFPMFSKVSVNGPEAHPLFSYLKSQEKGFLGTEAIKWNFTKFLIDKNGKVLKRYAPQTDPNTLDQEIKKLL